ncbi:hypothetical protein [Massilia sp. TS11]|uniref:hypothetical protein n=1 Tax=Massilia sp. TS11 TaxID=2908003 RepID=UPI001EDA1E9F|nr:hypothetical protein [Massilia sp. TS11]MCG2586061.1 hypothetical protein [Massilia sp. TS11]
MISLLLAFAAASGSTSFVIDGDIDGPRSEAAIAALRQGARTLIVQNSGGSDPLSARKLAEAVGAAGASVEVHGLCRDTCATYLFLPAPRKSLAEGGAIGLRDLALDQDYQDAIAHQADASHVSSRARENMLLARAGIDPNLLRRAHNAANATAHHAQVSYRTAKGVGMQYQDISAEGVRQLLQTLAKNEPKALDTLKVDTRWDNPRLWFPPRATLEQYGVRGIGSYAYPLNAEAAKALGEKFGAALVTAW